MKKLYSCGVAAFVIFLTCLYTPSANAHKDEEGHKILKAFGDANRALMDAKNGMGGSVFTLYAMPSSVVTISGTNKKGVRELGGFSGTAFIPECELCNGRYLLSNYHIPDLANKKEEVYKTMLSELIAFPSGSSVVIEKKYILRDRNNISFTASLVAWSMEKDIALFRFDKSPNPKRKSFALQDKNETGMEFGHTATVGSPNGIPGVLRNGNAASDKQDDCGGTARKYVIISAHTSPGNSGGFAYNLETDKIYGMVSAFPTYGDDQNTGITCAVPAPDLIQFLKDTLPLRKKAEMINGG